MALPADNVNLVPLMDSINETFPYIIYFKTDQIIKSAFAVTLSGGLLLIKSPVKSSRFDIFFDTLYHALLFLETTMLAGSKTNCACSSLFFKFRKFHVQFIMLYRRIAY